MVRYRPMICNHIRTLFIDANARILVNESLSPQFKLYKNPFAKVIPWPHYYMF